MSWIGLRWDEFPERGLSWFAPGADVAIGRSGQCQVVIPKERREVSRVHARLICESGRWCLWDQSAAGTLLDGVRVPPGTSVPVSDGARLTVGSYSFTLKLAAAGDEHFDDTAEAFGEITVSRIDPVALDTRCILDSALELPGRLAEASAEPAALAVACGYLVNALDPVITSAFVVETGDQAAISPRVLARHQREPGPTTAELPPPALSRRIIGRALREPHSVVFLTRSRPDVPLDATVVAETNSVGACVLGEGPSGRPWLIYVLGEQGLVRDQDLVAKYLTLVATLTRQHLLTLRRARMARYFSPKVLDLLMQGGADSEAMGPPRVLRATAFFLDLRGFSRTVDATADLLGLEGRLSEIITRVTEAIFEFQGIVIDYQGDAVFAAWGVPFPQPDQAALAARCALEVVHRLADLELNPIQPQRSGGRAICGIGLCTGEVLAGTVGSRELFKYGLLGPAVNVAKRIEELTKPALLDATIVCCAQMAQDLKERGIRTRRLARVRLEGMSRIEDLYELVASGSPPADSPWCSEHDQCWDAALAALESARTRADLAELVTLIGRLPANHPRTLWLHGTVGRLRKRRTLVRWDGVWEAPNSAPGR